MKAILLATALALTLPQKDSPINGKWIWQGSAGWQRITFDLKTDGSKVKGSLTMGPGAGVPPTPADFWEYFFDSADFEILNGRIEGDKIVFEQDAHIAGASEGKFVYRGVVSGDRIAFTRENVVRAKEPWVVGTHKVEFTAERVR